AYGTVCLELKGQGRKRLMGFLYSSPAHGCLIYPQKESAPKTTTNNTNDIAYGKSHDFSLTYRRLFGSAWPIRAIRGCMKNKCLYTENNSLDNLK
ncbi:MAG: hypothetical protein LBM77_00775, partial [Spirochaetaceae bacterium]|nr:hypothetical protein [Spirochaetaceae bacterium]